MTLRDPSTCVLKIELDHPVRKGCVSLKADGTTKFIRPAQSVRPKFTFLHPAYAAFSDKYVSGAAPISQGAESNKIGVYKSVHSCMNGGDIVIPPRSNAIISANGEATLRQRNQHIKDIESNGIYNWRRASDYYRQSTVESSFYRYKQIIGDELKARDEDSRQRATLKHYRLIEMILSALLNKRVTK